MTEHLYKAIGILEAACEILEDSNFDHECLMICKAIDKIQQAIEENKKQLANNH